MSCYLNVGLTGGIACGKSLVTSVFKALGCPVLDADQVYHSLIEPGKPLLKKLAARFGQGIIGDNGSLDRQSMAALVFGDSAAREKLNNLAHPAVLKEMTRLRKGIIKGLKANKIEEAVLVTDAALMIESGSYKLYDRIIVVASDEEHQIQRLMQRNSLMEDEARQRIASQMPVAEKVQFGDHVIYNNGTAKELIREVELVHARLFEGMHG